MEPAARPEQGTDPDAVGPDEGDQHGSHLFANPAQCFCNDPRRTEAGCRSATALATTTRSHVASRCRFSRKLSRTSRFRRLRRFARRIRFLATASPSRAPPPSLRERAKIEKHRSDERIGSWNTRRKSLPVRSRRSRPNERWRSSVRSSRRQARAAFGPPRLDDPPATAGTHLGAEPAAAFRPADTRLKRPFHSA